MPDGMKRIVERRMQACRLQELHVRTKRQALESLLMRLSEGNWNAAEGPAAAALWEGGPYPIPEPDAESNSPSLQAVPIPSGPPVMRQRTALSQMSSTFPSFSNLTGKTSGSRWQSLLLFVQYIVAFAAPLSILLLFPAVQADPATPYQVAFCTDTSLTEFSWTRPDSTFPNESMFSLSVHNRSNEPGQITVRIQLTERDGTELEAFGYPVILDGSEEKQLSFARETAPNHYAARAAIVSEDCRYETAANREQAEHMIQGQRGARIVDPD